MSIPILIDTNILISLEDNSPVRTSVSDLVRLLQDNGAQIIVHPGSVADLNRDRDSVRREIALSKLRKYPILSAPPALDRSLFTRHDIQIAGQNDEIDCTILTAIARHAARFLITEDRGLHSKARRLGLEPRVLTVDDALAAFEQLFAKHAVELPNLQLIRLHEINDELAGPFFESLRADYTGFDQWFNDSCEKQREAWIARDSSGNLGAVCIRKEEIDESAAPGLQLEGKSLKLCTFKVADNLRGQKIGELLLKASFRYAFQNGCEHIYVTVKPKHTKLIDLLSDFGFSDRGTRLDGDHVFVKEHPPAAPSATSDAVAYHSQFAPHFMAGGSIAKFLVPIQPKYHDLLFPDAPSPQLKLPIPKTVPGNAIKLAYLCRANIKAIGRGDVLVFYRSHDAKACTTLGIVESVDWLRDPDIILERVLKRTVYTRCEIEEISDGGCLVILFRLQSHFPEVIRVESLQKLGIDGPIQTIRKITNEQFQAIARLGKIEGCFPPD